MEALVQEPEDRREVCRGHTPWVRARKQPRHAGQENMVVDIEIIRREIG